MKDLEKAEKMLYDSGFDDILLSDEQGKRMYVSELMAKFANEVSKALLEEAAEKMESLLPDRSAGSDYEHGKSIGVEKSIEIVSSLIPKDS